mgnify:CR=1 FL=1
MKVLKMLSQLVKKGIALFDKLIGRTRRVRPMSCYSSTLRVTSLSRCTAP